MYEYLIYSLLLLGYCKIEYNPITFILNFINNKHNDKKGYVPVQPCSSADGSSRSES